MQLHISRSCQCHHSSSSVTTCVRTSSARLLRSPRRGSNFAAPTLISRPSRIGSCEFRRSGKVPLLKVGDDVIFESAVILEYLEETQPRPLYPADPLARARQRAFIEFGSAILSDIWGLEIAPNRDVLDARVEALAQKFARIEDELGRGPWFAGEAFGLVDAVFAPVLRYFDSFDAIFDHGILAHKPKIAAWRAALAARPSVRGAVSADYRDRLDRFIRGQNGALAALMTSKAA